MYILCGILFLILGFVMLRFPEFIYELTESWKSYSAGEPSALYKRSTQFGGVIFCLAGISAIVLEFLV